MNRRRFLVLASLSSLITHGRTGAQPAPATPFPINETFVVTWWEIDNSDPDYPIFRGDIQNVSDTVIDAPVIGITAYDADGNILGDSYATPEPPILEAGQRAFLYGSAPEDLPDGTVIELFTCSEPDGMTSYVDENANLDLELEVTEEDLGDDEMSTKGTVLNNGTVSAEHIAVIAVFSNPDGKVVGTLSTRLDRDVPAGKSMRWEIEHGMGTYHSSHPFTELLDPDYAVTYWAGYSPNARMIFC